MSYTIELRSHGHLELCYTGTCRDRNAKHPCVFEAHCDHFICASQRTIRKHTSDTYGPIVPAYHFYAGV